MNRDDITTFTTSEWTFTTYAGDRTMATIKLTQREIKAVRKAAKKNPDVGTALDKILEEVEFEVDPFGDFWSDCRGQHETDNAPARRMARGE